jgi:CelD/BcsL family acetyltransferase involved in cellulose biosynthesis
MAAIHTRLRLNFQVVPTCELGSKQISDWKILLDSDNRFSSPFFSPGYSRLMAQCADNVMTGLIMQDGKVVGVFPFELTRAHHAQPVGLQFCDYQGVIVRPDISWQAEDLLIGLGLDSWRYDHLLASQHQWDRFHKITDVSWSIDLSGGIEGYEAHLRNTNSGLLADTRRMWRMLEREVGPVAFTAHIVDHELLDKLLAWKAAKWAHTGSVGFLTSQWGRKVLHRLMETNQPDFGGMFSVLSAGGEAIAMHIGERTHCVWHYNTTAYDPEFKRYSPGILMLMLMARHATSIGITELDMGKEDFAYKRRFHTHVIPVAEGTAFANPTY